MSRVMSLEEAKHKSRADAEARKFDLPRAPTFASKEEMERVQVVREVYKESHLIKEKELKKR